MPRCRRCLELVSLIHTPPFRKGWQHIVWQQGMHTLYGKYEYCDLRHDHLLKHEIYQGDENDNHE